jgi:hypothetical protein
VLNTFLHVVKYHLYGTVYEVLTYPSAFTFSERPAATPFLACLSAVVT